MNDEVEFLLNAGLPMSDIEQFRRDGLELDEVAATVKRMQARGDISPPSEGRPPTVRRATPAAAFADERTKFLWEPYLPIGDYAVLMSPGGVGKTLFVCGIAAAVTTGRSLPGDKLERVPQNVLIISAEDPGPLLKRRLAASGADLMRTFILDCSDSTGLNFTDGYDEFEATVLAHVPSLVICDPWHGYLGSDADINRVNVLRPILQKLSLLAKKGNFAMILISHVNKREQGENANNAAIGSADFINASRSVMRLIRGETEDERVLVHTKSNYARAGQSVKFDITDSGGVEWTGFSDVTKETLELAARKRCTPWQALRADEDNAAVSHALIEAVVESANPFAPERISYEDFKKQHGDLIFGGQQPKRALDAIKDELSENGYFLKTGIQTRRNGKNANGFLIQKIEMVTPEQSQISGT